MFEKPFFSFTRAERRGLLFFLIFIACEWGMFALYKKWHAAPISLDTMTIWEDNVSAPIEVEGNDQINGVKKSMEGAPFGKLHRFRFDPNTIGYDSLLLLGFKATACRNLLKYREKGGVIRNKAKLGSIYGMDTVFLNSISGWIDYPDYTKERGNRTYLPTHSDTLVRRTIPMPVRPVRIELNTADSLEILALRGIGPALCRRILMFRRRMGGFLSLAQMSEMGIIHDTLIRNLEPSLWVDPEKIQAMNLNTVEYRQLVRHPYFLPEDVKAILQYRKQHGSFQRIEYIRRIRSIPSDRGEKMLPYLKVETVKE
jgi:competence protein ComEA